MCNITSSYVTTLLRKSQDKYNFRDGREEIDKWAGFVSQAINLKGSLEVTRTRAFLVVLLSSRTVCALFASGGFESRANLLRETIVWGNQSKWVDLFTELSEFPKILIGHRTLLGNPRDTGLMAEETASRVGRLLPFLLEMSEMVELNTKYESDLAPLGNQFAEFVIEAKVPHATRVSYAETLMGIDEENYPTWQKARIQKP